MQTVTVSSKFQIVIPRQVRTSMDIQAGEKMEVIPFRGRIELLPVRDMKSMRGFLHGIDTTIKRDENRV